MFRTYRQIRSFFLSEHISKYGNKGKGNLLYLSSIICDDFLCLMNNLVLKKIVVWIIEAKYFSIIVDSTPDISKQDQLTIVIRYTKPNGFLKKDFELFYPHIVRWSIIFKAFHCMLIKIFVLKSLATHSNDLHSLKYYFVF